MPPPAPRPPPPQPGRSPSAKPTSPPCFCGPRAPNPPTAPTWHPSSAGAPSGRADPATAPLEGAGLALEKAGAAVEPSRLPGAEEAVAIYTGILGGDGGAGLRRVLEAVGTTEPSPLIAGTLEVLSANVQPASHYADLL